MKKFAFFATALMVLASCSNTDELMGTGTSGTQSAKQAITFESPFVNKNTRASGEIDYKNITQQKNIKVWGFTYSDADFSSSSAVIYGDKSGETVFYGAGLSYDGNTWNYTNYDGQLAYWDRSQYSYQFYGVINPLYDDNSNRPWITKDNSSNRYSLHINNIPAIQSFNHSSDQNEEGGASAGSVEPADILVAQSYTLASKGGSVTLNFQHILSRLNVYAYYKDGATPVTLTNLKLYLPKSDLKYLYEIDGTAKWTPVDNGFEPVKETPSSAAELTNGTYECYEVVKNDMSLVSASSAFDIVNNYDEIKKKYLCPMGFYVAPQLNLENAAYLEAEYKLEGSDEVRKVDLSKINFEQDFIGGNIINLVLRVNGDGRDPITIKVSTIGWGEDMSINGSDLKN